MTVTEEFVEEFRRLFGDGVEDLISNADSITLDVDYYLARTSGTKFWLESESGRYPPLIVSAVIKEPNPAFSMLTGIRFWVYAHLPVDDEGGRPEYYRPILVYSEEKPTPENFLELEYSIVAPNSIIENAPPPEKEVMHGILLRASGLMALAGVEEISFDPDHPHWKNRKIRLV